VTPSHIALRELLARPERTLPAAPPLVTLPIVLIALLKFGQFGVHLFKARDGSSTWYFRFSPRAVLQVRDDGDWCWQQATARWRREIEPYLARAEALLAEGGDHSGTAEPTSASGAVLPQTPMYRRGCDRRLAGGDGDLAEAANEIAGGVEA
jgi:hypothetical protein